MMVLKRLFPLLLLLAVVVVVPVYGDDDDLRAAWCVSVWYPSSEFAGGQESILNNTDIVNEVNAFWYMPAPDGSLIVLPRAENEDELAAWREAGLLILPSIFGSVPDVIGENLRQAHVEAIVQTVIRMDYDGFPASTREDFVLFIDLLRDALHAEDRLLSVTVHAKTDNGIWEGAIAQDWERLIPASDIFRIMSYDYTNRNEPPGPIAPTAWVLDVLAYAQSVTDNDDDFAKVRLGLHFYGYSWQRGTPPATTVAYAGIQNYLNNFNLDILRNPDDMEAYIDFHVQGLPRQIVYFADPIGLTFKLEQVIAQYPNIGGVSIWGVGGEHPELWDTLRTFTSGCV
jgi:spore germination protein